MTREDVLSGMKFKYNGQVYQAKQDKDYPESGMLTSWLGHEANVDSFGPYAMRWFSYVMGKKVSGLINYKKLEPYVEAK